MRGLLIIYFLMCAGMIYLIFDWVRDELKKRRKRDKELEDWNK